MTTRRERERRNGRLARQRFNKLAGDIARAIRLSFDAGDIGSLLGLEGPLRHAVRADLCLLGWRWIDANFTAILVVDDALRRVRAQRPSWNEGQREWTISEGLLIERTRCVECHKALPEGHYKYCGHLCSNAYRLRAAYRRKGTEKIAEMIATQSI